jgi:hypothetical protein
VRRVVGLRVAPWSDLWSPVGANSPTSTLGRVDDALAALRVVVAPRGGNLVIGEHAPALRGDGPTRSVALVDVSGAAIKAALDEAKGAFAAASWVTLDVGSVWARVDGPSPLVVAGVAAAPIARDGGYWVAAGPGHRAEPVRLQLVNWCDRAQLRWAPSWSPWSDGPEAGWLAEAINGLRRQGWAAFGGR